VITLRLVLFAALAAVLVAAGWIPRGWIAEREIAELRESQARAQAQAIQAAREEEKRRAQAIQEVADEARERSAELARDAAAADDVSRRLRDHIFRLVAADAGSPAPSLGGPPTGGAGLVFAQLLVRADDRAGELAAFADAAHAAGLACQRAYDKVRGL
jgi:hypothetical protein